MLHTADTFQQRTENPAPNTASLAKDGLKKALEQHGLDFIESIWQITLTQSNNSFIRCQHYLTKCGISFELTERVKTDELAGVREYALVFDSDDQIRLLLREDSSVHSWKAPFQVISILARQQNNPDSLNNELSGFWIKLLRTDWVRESMELGLPTYSPLIVTSVLINLLALAPAIFSMQVYDRVIPNKAFESLFALAAGVLICLMFEHFLKKARHGLMEHAATLMDLSCAKRLSHRLLSAKSHQTNAGKLLQHLRSFEQLRELITGISLVSLVDLPFLLIFLGVLTLIHPLFLVVALCTITLSLLNVLIIHRKLQKAGQKQVSLVRQSQTEWINAVTHLPVLQKLGVQELRSDSLTEIQLAQRLAGNEVRHLIFSSSQTQYLIQQTGWVSIIILGVLLAADNLVTIGGMIAASMLSMRAFTPLLKIQGHLVQSHVARSGFGELDQFLSSIPTALDKNLALSELQRVELNNAKVELTSGSAQLREISLSLRQGDKLALIGTNSSGKTTLLNLLAAAYPITEGSLLINGLDASRISPSELARQIAISEQPPSIIEGTILSNIKMDRPWVSTDDCFSALVDLDMLGWVESLPRGLQTEVSTGGVNLSAGKRQLLSIARALAGRPRLLLLDEPSVCLDQAAESQLLKCIESLPAEMIVVIATHRKALLAPMTQIALLKDGRIIQQGAKSEVLGEERKAKK